MNKTTKIILIVLAFLTLVGCIIWFFKRPDYDSGTASLVALSAFIAAFFINDSDSNGTTILKQKAGNNSNLYQAGKDLTINK